MEAQRSKLTERRTEPRHSFVRPVQIYVAQNPPFSAFSKDMSKQGIGVVADHEMAVGTMAVISIHSTTHYPVHVNCELRWSEKFGPGWFLTRWKFISIVATPRP